MRALKKTRKWILITKLQANVRGWLHRNKVKKGLQALNKMKGRTTSMNMGEREAEKDDGMDEFDDLEDFFNADENDIDKDLKLPDDDDLMKMFGAM